MAAQYSVYLIGAPTSAIFPVQRSEFRSFSSLVSAESPKKSARRLRFPFTSPENQNSFFFSIYRSLPSLIFSPASDSTLNCPNRRINPIAADGFCNPVASDSVGFPGDDTSALYTGDAASKTSAVVNFSEKLFRLIPPAGLLRLESALLLLSILLFNSIFGIRYLWNREREEPEQPPLVTNEGDEMPASTDDCSSVVDGEDEMQEKILRIRAMSREVRERERRMVLDGSDEGHAIEEDVDEGLTEGNSVPLTVDASGKYYEKAEVGDVSSGGLKNMGRRGDGVVRESMAGSLKIEGRLFIKGRDDSTMLVQKGFNLWGRMRNPGGAIRASSSSDGLDFSVNDDMFDGMRTRRKPKGPEDEEEEGLTVGDMWWCTLPYVNAIYINTGSGEDHFFTFKMMDRPTAYLVTFEDHSDACNFCYSCHTSFDDPDNYKPATVPVTVTDLLKITELENVIVVRKGQFSFYAGQPFPELEMALRHLISRRVPMEYILQNL